jgi:hypothetical protein
LGRLGIRSIFYLDDILVLGSTFHNCLSNLQRALLLLIEAGFIINWEKSSLVPTTNFTFLGMIWDSVEGALSLPQDKLLHLRSQAMQLLNCPTPSCRQVMVLTGLVAAFYKAVPLLRLKGRFVQLSLNFSYFLAQDLLKTPPRGEAQPPLDDAAPDRGLSRSPVAADCGGLPQTKDTAFGLRVISTAGGGTA